MGREGEREGEKHWRDRETPIGCLQHTPQPGTKPATPAGCPDWESNQQPSTLWDDTQPTEPHQSGNREIVKDAFSLGFFPQA